MTSLDASPAELAGLLRALLKQLDADPRNASTLLRARTEGALAAAEVLAGESAEGILARLEASRSPT